MIDVSRLTNSEYVVIAEALQAYVNAMTDGPPTLAAFFTDDEKAWREFECHRLLAALLAR